MLPTIHLVEIGNLVDIAYVDDAEILHLVGDPIQDFVLSHAVGVMVAAETDRYSIELWLAFCSRGNLACTWRDPALLTDNTFCFRKNGLVNMPAGAEMR